MTDDEDFFGSNSQKASNRVLVKTEKETEFFGKLVTNFETQLYPQFQGGSLT
jgi:hypothetical protein